MTYYWANNVQAKGKIATMRWYIDNVQKLSTSYSYDNFGRVSSQNFSCGATFSKQYSYYTSGVQTSERIIRVRELCASAVVHNTAYTYNADNQLTGETDATTSLGVTYQYDGLGRIVRENNRYTSETLLYSYNSNGNLSGVRRFSYTTSTTPSGSYSDKLFTYSSSNPCVLASYNGIAITSNNQGAPTAYSGKSFSWSYGRLASYSEGGSISEGSGSYTYSYDAFGRRISKSYTFVPGTTPPYEYTTSEQTNYTYDNEGRLVFEQSSRSYNRGSSDNWSMKYLYNDTGVQGCVFTLNGSTTTYFYRKNLQGDICEVYTSSGTSVGCYYYDAFGNTTASTTNAFLSFYNPFRYRGYYYDKETGFYHISSLLYCPEWRRFLNAPDIGSANIQSTNALNKFTYVHNDPVNFLYRKRTSLNLIGKGVPQFFLQSEIETSVTPTINPPILSLDFDRLNFGIKIIRGTYALYSTGSSIIRNISYFSKNMRSFADDMRLLGVSSSEGVLAFNNFSWSLGWLDWLGLAIDVGYDIYTGIKRDDDIKDIAINALVTFTADIALLYIGKGVTYLATTIGGLFGPTGAAVGHIAGLLLSLILTQALYEPVRNIADQLIHSLPI